MVKTYVSWMNVYLGLTVKEDEQRHKRVYLLGSWNKHFMCS
jgi:hypothetical protein